MKINVYFQSGRIDVFDTSTFCCVEPFRKDGTDILTNFSLRLDSLAEDGLVLEAYWYAAPRERDGRSLPVASMMPGFRLLLVSPEELQEIAKITCDGELLVWRQGEDLINGTRFAAQETLCFSDSATVSINARSLAVFNYLKRAHPECTDEEVARMLGYSTRALDAVRRAELANSDPEVFEDDGENKPENGEDAGNAPNDTPVSDDVEGDCEDQGFGDDGFGDDM